nr:MAG TPA: hypothetical protein [Caudoviricetes sp.]DAV67933.1 MAG TPA: hypothetical protein [Caudoviricetes sp.]
MSCLIYLLVLKFLLCPSVSVTVRPVRFSSKLVCYNKASKPD